MSISTLIQQLFEKKGITKLGDLAPDEKAKYDEWQATIDGTEVTVEKLKEFCEKQIKIIEDVYSRAEQTDKKDTMLRASLHVYLNLLKLMESTEAERASLERYLTDLLKNN